MKTRFLEYIVTASCAKVKIDNFMFYKDKLKNKTCSTSEIEQQVK